MAQSSTFPNNIPPEVASSIMQLGEHIRTARKRRAITMEEMASRMFVTRKTLSRLENGAPGVSLAIFASALWVLGLEKDLLNVALPEEDEVGTFLERRRLPKRVRTSKTMDELDF